MNTHKNARLMPKGRAGLAKQRLGVLVDEDTTRHILRELGFSRISARPQHLARGACAIEGFKKTFAERLGETLSGVAHGTAIEIWFQDEIRIGQKNGYIRQWAPRGSRPRQPADQRYESAYIFGAVCSACDIGAALILLKTNIYTMQIHISEISAYVCQGSIGILVKAQAAWRTTARLKWPDNLRGCSSHRPVRNSTRPNRSGSICA